MKSNSPALESFSTKSKSNYRNHISIEDRLISQGLKTQQKFDDLKMKRNEEIKQMSSPKINRSYPFKAKAVTIHTHLVESEDPIEGRYELLDPLRQNLNMSEGKGWSELSMLERNQLWLTNKNAKIKKQVEIKLK